MAEWAKAAVSALLESQVEPVIGEMGLRPQSCSSSWIGTRKSPAKGRGARWDSVRFMIFDMMVLKSEEGQGWLLALTEVNSPKPRTELFTPTSRPVPEAVESPRLTWKEPRSDKTSVQQIRSVTKREKVEMHLKNKRITA